MNRFEEGLQSWLEHLRLIFPPTGALVAGSGIGSWVEPLKAWGVSDVVLAEADAAQIERMHKAYSLPEHWRVSQSLLWSEPGEHEFYYASNPSLNGAVSPEAFLPLWPNLTAKRTELRDAVTIAQLLNNDDIESRVNWFIIDCLPALPLLQGAGGRLGECDVVLARVLADEAGVSAPDAAKSDLDPWLAAEGFNCVAAFEEDHPEMLLSLYVRDWRAKCDRDDRRYETLSTENKTLTSQYESSIKALEQKVTELVTQKEELQNVVAEKETKLAHYRAEQERALEKAQAEIAKLKESEEEQTALQKVQTELTALHEGTKNLETELVRLKETEEQNEKELQALQAQNAELQKESEEKLSETQKLIQEIKEVKLFLKDQKTKSTLQKKQYFNLLSQSKLEKNSYLLHNDFQHHIIGCYDDMAFEFDWGYSPNPSSGVSDKRLYIVNDPDDSNKKVLRVTCEKLMIGGNSGSVFRYEIPAQKQFKSLWLQYKVRFDQDFEWMLGGKLPGLAGYIKNKPTGCIDNSEIDGFSARFMWQQNGHLIQYLYFPEKEHVCGDDYITKVFLEKNKWYTLSSYVELNKIENHDGIVRLYVNDEEVLSLNGLLLRNAEEVSINMFLFEIFFGGSTDSWASKKDEYVYINDIIISENKPKSEKTIKKLV